MLEIESEFFYVVPVIDICTLNDVIEVIVGEAVIVKVATVDCPGASTVPSLFHARVNGPFALVGFQLVDVMLSVKEDDPCVFLMYTN